MISVHLLGPPQVMRDGASLTVMRRKSRALLYYLAARGEPVPRSRLLPLLWPEMEASAARRNLRTTLYQLRKEVDDHVIAAGDALALAPDTFVDAREFEARLAAPDDAPDLQETLELYRGDFLSGFALPDSTPYDDWVTREEERYRRMWIRGWSALSRRHETAGRYQEALDALDRVLAENPLQEDLQRTALRLHYLAGDRAGAIRRYDRLRQILDEELGVPPMAETRALYDALLSDRLPQPERATQPPDLPATRPAAVPPGLPFTGRTGELETLGRVLGEARLALVEGEGGIGKTRLAHTYLDSSDTLPLIGAGRELERSLPYQPVIEALRGLLADPQWPALEPHLDLAPVWRQEAARLVPELATGTGAMVGDSPPDESRVWEGISRFLQAVAAQRALTLFLDDLHWADGSTLALLGYLVRRSASDRLGFLAASRPPAPRSALATLLSALMREGHVQRVPLERLSRGEVETLAADLSPAHAETLADWLYENSEGNPYVLTELAREIRKRGWLEEGSDAPEALPETPLVPSSVYSLIHDRLARLSDAARRVLDAAVAAGRQFDFAVVARAAGMSEEAALDALDELRSAGLVSLTGDRDRYSFDHNLTMEVAYREIGEPRHRRIHRQVAQAIERVYRGRLPEVAGQLAWHYAEGEAPKRAAPYAWRAGQRAERVAAWREAIYFYELALHGAPPEQRVQICRALGNARYQIGEAARAAEAFRDAHEQARALGERTLATEARIEWARALVPQARYGEVVQMAREALEDATRAQACQAEILWGTALSLEGEDLEGAAEHLRRAEALCAGESREIDLAHVKFERGSVAAQQGDLRKAVALYREALQVAGEATGNQADRWLILAHNNLAYHLHLLDDPAAETYARQGLDLAEEHGALGLKPYLLSTLGEIAFASGRLDAAEAHFREGLALAERLSIPERIAGLTANLGRVAAARGESSLAVHRLSTALAQADSLGTRHLAARVRIWLAPLLPSKQSRARLQEAREIAARSGRGRLLDEVEMQLREIESDAEMGAR